MLGAEAEDGQRQPDLVVQVALVLQRRHRRAEDRRDRLLRRGLRDRAGDRRRRAGRSGGARRSRSPGAPAAGRRPATIVASTAARSTSSGGRATITPAAPAASAAATKRWPSVRSPGRATKRLPGRTSRESTAPPRIGRSERARSAPPVAATRSSAVSPRSVPSVSRGRRIAAIGHAAQCRTGAAHRVAVVLWVVPSPSAVAGSGASVRSGSRSGVVIASWAIRRNSSNDITGISSWPSLAIVGVPSSIRIRDDQVRPPGLPGDVADERVVEDVVLPGALAAVAPSGPRSGRCPSCRRRRSPGSASGRGRTGPSMTTWFIIPTSVFDSVRRDHLALRAGSRRALTPTAWTMCGWIELAAVHHRRVGRRELERRDRDALAERAVREVDLAPRPDRRVADDAADLAGEVDPGRRAEPEPGPRRVEDRRRAPSCSCRARARPSPRRRCASRRSRPRRSSSPSPCGRRRRCGSARRRASGCPVSLIRVCVVTVAALEGRDGRSAS